jgi:[acyl-carrier-protein] S-malonyltransferase
MKKAYLFPGQASQFEGMGKDLYEQYPHIQTFFEEANDILGFKITDPMFYGSMEDLSQTKVTQPAVFLHSIAKTKVNPELFQPDMVAGHSLGEFSALTSAGVIEWQDALKLVFQRAMAMQKACNLQKSTMAAILGMEDESVEKICSEIGDDVIAANYNCPGQIVISGSVPAVELAIQKLTEAGAKRAVLLPVSGAFHSKFMQPAQDELAEAIQNTSFKVPICPIFQNYTSNPTTQIDEIKSNLEAQLTAPVKWTQSILNMIIAGASEFIEVGGNGKTLQAFVKKIDKSIPTSAL